MVIKNCSLPLLSQTIDVMNNHIKTFLKNLNIKELQEVRDNTDILIRNYEDGFVYECHVRSYGRMWTERHLNEITLQELLYDYSGDDGVVDVYTNNPNLDVSNYGNTFYFPTMEDAEVWRRYTYIQNNIPIWKKDLEEWQNRDNVPFNKRPLFEPYYKEQDIINFVLELETLSNTIIEPVNLGGYIDVDNQTNDQS